MVGFLLPTFCRSYGGVCSNWLNSCFRRRSFWAFGFSVAHCRFAASTEKFRRSMISLADFACRWVLIFCRETESNCKSDNCRRTTDVSRLEDINELSTAIGCEAVCMLLDNVLSSAAEMGGNLGISRRSDKWFTTVKFNDPSACSCRVVRVLVFGNKRLPLFLVDATSLTKTHTMTKSLSYAMSTNANTYRYHV